jgi:Xaa-Pro dipeptidase
MDDDLTRRHEAVTRVDARMISASRPGTSLAEVVRAAIDQYEREGFRGEWLLHHQGGLTGYAGREIFGTPSAGHELGPNQAVAWNPSITRVKSEDIVLVTNEGFEILTHTGEWPVEQVRVGGGTVARPAVLEKGAT